MLARPKSHWPGWEGAPNWYVSVVGLQMYGPAFGGPMTVKIARLKQGMTTLVLPPNGNACATKGEDAKRNAAIKKETDVRDMFVL